MKTLYFFRSLIMALFYPIFLMICSLTILAVIFTVNNRDWEDKIAQIWGRLSCWMFGVKVVLRGQENIPHGGCVFLFNHTSFFDIFAMQGVLPGFRFGAKIELFSIPIFGAAMKKSGALPIARQKRDEVFKVYEAAQARIHNGEKFALAPEGTRQESEVLGPFKAGPFVFAINAKAPLVPVVIRGAADILPKGHFVPNSDRWTRTITIDVLPPVSSEGYDIKDRPVLQEKIRKEMLPYFPETSV